VFVRTILLLAFCLAAFTVRASLHERLKEAASAVGKDRPGAIDAYLEALRTTQSPPHEQLRYVWYGFFLAENDAQRLQVLDLASKIPLPEARMVLFGLTDGVSIQKQVAMAQKAQDELLARLPGAKRDKSGRVTFGQNPYDKMAAYECFNEPPPWVGRWSGAGVELDLNAFPSGTIAGRIRAAGTGEDRVVGWDEQAPRVFGPGWDAVWRGDRFVLNGQGRKNVALERVMVGRVGKTPPPNAKVIFEGRDMNALTDKKGGPATWKITPEAWLEIPPGVGDHRTRESFGDVRLYMEYRQSFNPEGINRKRGNGGVYLQSNYEIQLTDNFANDVNEALSGAIYHIATPMVNASAPPMEWQSLEVEFFTPRYDAAGRKTADARMTVWQNGVKIHDNVALPRITGGGKGETGDPLPINIQAHGGLLQFRNIWAQPLEVSCQ